MAGLELKALQGRLIARGRRGNVVAWHLNGAKRFADRCAEIEAEYAATRVLDGDGRCQHSLAAVMLFVAAIDSFELGGHVAALYVLGVGVFGTAATERGQPPSYRIDAWLGLDRLFRFVTELRQGMDRWPPLRPGWSLDLSGYLPGEPTTITE
jgi:hypothetical protein